MTHPLIVLTVDIHDTNDDDEGMAISEFGSSTSCISRCSLNCAAFSIKFSRVICVDLALSFLGTSFRSASGYFFKYLVIVPYLHRHANLVLVPKILAISDHDFVPFFSTKST